jgi:hypothetical protein
MNLPREVLKILFYVTDELVSATHLFYKHSTVDALRLAFLFRMNFFVELVELVLHEKLCILYTLYTWYTV